MADTLSYLIEKIGLSEVNRYMNEGLSLEEVTQAVKSIVSDGRESELVEAEPSEDTPKRRKRLHLTEEILCEHLNRKGMSVRLNVVTHDVEVDGIPDTYNPETRRQDLPIILYDELKIQYQCDRQTIVDLLSLIAGRNRYNPVLDVIDGGEWDNHDHTLSLTLLYKWLAQCYWMLHNDIQGAFGADGMLVLQGPQGIGKTSFVRVVGIRPEFVKLGQYLDTHDKDTLRRCTSAWIVELGEIETTLKSDIERLKAFITAEKDEYRLPYGRADQTLARRTSLIGTCNSSRFLIDPTGSRRFWTVPIEEIDLDRLNSFDSLQLWRQIKIMCENNPNEFRLTKEERRQLEARNCQHEKPLKAQEEIEDIFADAENDSEGFEWRYTTVSEFKVEYNSLSRYTVEQIGRALDKLGILCERKKVDGSVQRLRRLPCHRWGCTAVVPRLKKVDG